MGVAREMGRLIRLSYNGHLPPEELTRYIFALDKLRACLESAVAIETAAAEAAETKAEPTVLTVNVTGIPSGHYHQADGSFAPLPLTMLQLEHTPRPEPKLQVDEPAPEPIEKWREPQPARAHCGCRGRRRRRCHHWIILVGAAPSSAFRR